MGCGGDISEEATKDPGIKLFGRKIPLPEDHVPVKSEVMDDRNGRAKAVEERSCAEKLGESQKSSALVDRDPQNPVQAETSVSSAAKGGEGATNATEQEKVLKKPEKVLQCPRCNSLDSKFCYFNNYNVNQPRHFCKNCQRYWTAGGTMRNVPVGAGRRKNKHLASQYRHVIVSSDGVALTRSGATDLDNHRLLSCSESSTPRSSGGNGTLLTFGHEGPLCESMETVLSLRDQKRYVEMGSVSVEENEEPSCISSMTASGNQGNQLPENVVHRERVSLSGSYNDLHIPSPLHCYSVPPWGVPWKAGLHNDASVAKAENASECISVPNGSDTSPVRWFPTPMLAVPGFCPSSVPLQYSPASYWGCMPVWAPGAGGASVTGSSSCLSPSSPASKSCCSRNGSPTLGKHSRDVKPTDEYTSETCILVPKTLRFVDPGEVSESPVWAARGIQPGQKGSISKGSIFGTFESKAEDREHLDEASEILVANPAALSRSHTFQEST